MSAKAYLNSARALSLSIKATRNRIAELESLKTAIGSPPLSFDSVQTSKSGEARFTAIVEKIIDEQEKLSILVGNYSDALSQISEEIRQLENPVYAEVLYRRYLDYQGFVEIAYKMHYSFSYTRNLHQRALRAFENMFPERC